MSEKQVQGLKLCRGASAGKDDRTAFVLPLTVVVALAVVAAACTNQTAAPPASIPATVAPLAAQPAEQVETVPTLFYPPGFVPADTRGVKLPVLVVKDGEQPPIPVFGGGARMSGTVLGPDGPVEGGVVRLERFVGGRGGYADVPTGAGGRWEAVGVYGGHYRLRAWLRPNLATTEPQVGFVTDVKDSNVEFAIGVEKREAKRLQAALDVGDPRVGETVTLQVLYDQEDVNADGIVVGKGLPDTDIALTVGDGYEIVGESTARTGADGLARFAIRCTSVGTYDVTVDGGGLSQNVTLPECVSPDDPSAGGSSTTTPEPGDADTTTTSTPVLGVGSTFTTPYLPEIPAGTYVATTRRGQCSTEYELYVFTGWQQMRQVGSPLVVPYPARNLVPTDGSLPCTYRRTK